MRFVNYGTKKGTTVDRVTDPLEHTTRHEYDALNRKTADILPQPDGASGDGPTTAYTYDLAGNLLTYTDPSPAQNVTTYGYDNLNRRTTEENALGQTPQPESPTSPARTARTAPTPTTTTN